MGDPPNCAANGVCGNTGACVSGACQQQSTAIPCGTAASCTGSTYQPPVVLQRQRHLQPGGHDQLRTVRLQRGGDGVSHELQQQRPGLRERQLLHGRERLVPGEEGAGQRVRHRTRMHHRQLRRRGVLQLRRRAGRVTPARGPTPGRARRSPADRRRPASVRRIRPAATRAPAPTAPARRATAGQMCSGFGCTTGGELPARRHVQRQRRLSDPEPCRSARRTPVRSAAASSRAPTTPSASTATTATAAAAPPRRASATLAGATASAAPPTAPARASAAARAPATLARAARCPASWGCATTCRRAAPIRWERASISRRPVETGRPATAPGAAARYEFGDECMTTCDGTNVTHTLLRRARDVQRLADRALPVADVHRHDLRPPAL